MKRILVASLVLPLLVTCIAISPALMIPAPPPKTSQSLVQLTSGSSSSIDPSFSPSGATISYASQTSGGLFQIWTMTQNGDHRVRLTSLPGNATRPQWSPNGEEIAFLETEHGESNIWTVSPEGKNPSQLTRSQEIVSFQWSPDSGKIVYEEVANGSSVISIANALSGQRSLLLHDGSQEYKNPIWNPNGSSIAFSCNSTGAFHIWIISENGNGLSQLTSGNGSDFNPRFGPTGSTLLYTSNRSGYWDVWMLNLVSGVDVDITAVSAQTMGSQLFIDGLNPNVNPILSPSGLRILFTFGTFESNPLYVAQPSNASVSLFQRISKDPSQFFISGLAVNKSVLQSSYDWSPDGSQVAFSAKVMQGYQVFVTVSRVVQPKSSYG